MPKVSNLKLELQKGTDSTYFATWEFNESAKKPPTGTSPGAPSGLSVGSWVTIKSGATYYNGVSIPSWVLSDTWKVIQLQGDRAVLGKNKSGSNDIQSPINTKYLIVSSSKAAAESEIVKYLDHYFVKWYYATGDGIWFVGTESDNIKVRQATYGAPSNAIGVKVSVKPVSKTHKVNDEDVSYWTGSWVSKWCSVSANPPEIPSAPTVKIDKYKLTASIENIADPRTDQIQFEVYSGVKKVKTGIVTVRTRRATFSCTISAGTDYRVRCRAINLNGKTKIYSSWSEFSSSAGTIPSCPKYITKLKALSEASVYIDWTKVANATSYTIEYTTKKSYFDTSSEVKSMTVEAIAGHAEVTGLESGKEYFFRVQAVNDIGKSAWGQIKSITIGKKPAAPTTWSSTTTVITGEPLTLYWVHNSEDGSSETYADIELYINEIKEMYTIKNESSEDEKDKVGFYIVNTSSYIEGTTIRWRVRTAGITKQYGDWSIERLVDVYAPPTLTLNMTDINGGDITTLTSFPFNIHAVAGPETQQPIGYHLSIISNQAYETVDNIGNFKMVNVGEEVYSKYFEISEVLDIKISANDVNLDNDMSYTMICTVSMNSGLTATSKYDFTVSWADLMYEPDAEIGIDSDTYSAYISPYCIDDTGAPITDVLLSVYRREFDGSFTEIATGIDTASNEYIYDPHPALDYARYRIVATSKTTGAVSFYDPPGYPVGAKSIIIQWDDEWVNFDATTEDELETPPWTGSLIKLPYNIDVTEGAKPEVSLVKYIGRAHPVSYYGTQIESTASWNVAIDKDDKETIYNLRRLSIWLGDVYVREPSGVGYWANVSVSFGQKHLELTIPVTLDITRVEGGV